MFVRHLKWIFRKRDKQISTLLKIYLPYKSVVNIIRHVVLQKHFFKISKNLAARNNPNSLLTPIRADSSCVMSDLDSIPNPVNIMSWSSTMK